jgi:hypothetical protein
MPSRSRSLRNLMRCRMQLRLYHLAITGLAIGESDAAESGSELQANAEKKIWQIKEAESHHHADYSHVKSCVVRQSWTFLGDLRRAVYEAWRNLMAQSERKTLPCYKENETDVALWKLARLYPRSIRKPSTYKSLSSEISHQLQVCCPPQAKAKRRSSSHAVAIMMSIVTTRMIPSTWITSKRLLYMTLWKLRPNSPRPSCANIWHWPK